MNEKKFFEFLEKVCNKLDELEVHYEEVRFVSVQGVYKILIDLDTFYENVFKLEKIAKEIKNIDKNLDVKIYVRAEDYCLYLEIIVR